MLCCWVFWCGLVGLIGVVEPDRSLNHKPPSRPPRVSIHIGSFTATNTPPKKNTDLVVRVGVGEVDDGDAKPCAQRGGEEVEGLREGAHVPLGLGVEELVGCWCSCVVLRWWCASVCNSSMCGFERTPRDW